MKKKIVIALMLVVMAMSLTACGKFTCFFCGEEKIGKRHTSAWSDEIVVCHKCYKELEEAYGY